MPTPLRVLELRSVRGTGGGPEKTILVGASRSTSERVHTTVCYIRDERDKTFGIDHAARRLGVDYVEIRERHSFDPRVWPALRALVRERAIDLVHAHDYKTNLFALALGWRDGIIPMSTAHGWAGHTLRELLVYYPADKFLTRFFPRVIAVSEHIREELIRCGTSPERVTTVLNGIDPLAHRRMPGRREAVRAEMGISPNDIVIGGVGRLAPVKRFDLLVEAVARCSAEYPQLNLVIAGDGESKTGIQMLASRLGLGSRVRLLGQRSDVADLHHAFDLFVQSSSYEGTPNVVLEAMAMETPIVATAAGGTAQIVRDGVDGIVVPTNDAGALDAAIRRCLADPAAAAARAGAARARVEQDLSFGSRLRTIERLCEELAATEGRERRAAVRAA